MAKKVGNTYFFTGKGKSSGGGGGGGDATDAIKYTEQTLNESQQMQARKNQGLYYSEGGGDVALTWDGDTTGLESVDIGDGVVLYKVSDDAPQKESVKSLGMTVGGVEQIINIPQQSIITIEGGYGLGDAYIIVATESEASLESYTFTKGIWFVKGTTGNYVSKFTYGATETVHQIPAKYIPSTGLDVFEIEFSALNPLQLGEAELPNYTYEQIANAVESGKLLVLTLKQDGASENEVRGRYIGGQLSRMYNPDSDYGRPCIRIPAAYSYLDQTIQGKFNSTIVKDIVIYEDWSQGGDEPILMLGVEDSFTNQ